MEPGGGSALPIPARRARKGSGCVATSRSTSTITEFYQINEDRVPKLDTENANLLADDNQLTRVQQKNFDELNARLKALLASQPSCLADVNLDGVVNRLDVDQWAMFRALTLDSSWADIDQDGRTDNDDLDIILQNFGRCPK